MNSVLSPDSALARRRARHAASQRALRAAMTPTQRALSLQRRRDQYRSRRDAAATSTSSVAASSSAARFHSVSSLGATSLAAPSAFASTSDRLQPLTPSGVRDVITVLQSHVDREVLRMFGSSFHCRLDADNSQLGFDLDCPLHNQPDSDDDQPSDDDGAELPVAASLLPSVRAVGARTRRCSPLQRSAMSSL